MKSHYRQAARNKRAQRDHWADADSASAIDANDSDGEDAADEAEAAGAALWPGDQHTPAIKD